MMDFSIVSTVNNSKRFFDTSFSVLNQSYEVPTMYSEFSSIADYNPNSNINNVYNGFKEITKNCSENNNYLKMVEDFGETLNGHLLALRKNLTMFARSNNEITSSASIISSEIQTWKLISLLYEDRFRQKLLEKTSNLPNMSHSELEVLSTLFQSNINVREAQIVVDWLEYFMKDKVDNNTEFLIGSHGKSWEQTKYLMKKNNLNNKTKSINELDPDAPLRGKLNLVANDKTNENEYLRYLYYIIQSGDIDKAKIVCQNHDELWRAQSLEGWKPFHNPLTRDNNSDMIHDDVIGNPNRACFKLMCQKLSEKGSLNLYERGIYAIFCGNLPVLEMIEKDWKGLLWAHFKVFIQSNIDKYLMSNTDTGFFKTQSLFGDDDLDMDNALFRMLNSTQPMLNGSKYDNFGLEEIFNEISIKLVHDPMDILNQGFNAGQSYYLSIYEMVQKFIITEKIIDLVHHIQTIITTLPEKKSLCDKNAIRFLTHLIVFIYSIHDGLPIDIYHTVLEQYIKCLLDEKCLDNLAFYISKLSTDLQIKWYCKCLQDVTAYQERRRCIEEALEYHLPIVDVTRLLIQYYRTKDTSNIADQRGTLNITSLEDKPNKDLFFTEQNKVSIDAIDWLTFLPEQQCHLIREVNAFCRTFIEMDKLQAAKKTMVKITDEIWTQINKNASHGPQWLSSALYENECIRVYLECHTLFEDWYDHFTCQKPTDLDINVNVDISKLSFQEKQAFQKKHDDHMLNIQQWEKLLHYRANKAFDCILTMLKMGSKGWLSDCGDDFNWMESDETLENVNKYDNDTCINRKNQVYQLRKKCIVSIVFMALKMLSNSDEHERCFVLSDLLADDCYRLFAVFDNKMLQTFLQKIKQSSLHLMSEGKDALVIPF